MIIKRGRQEEGEREETETQLIGWGMPLGILSSMLASFLLQLSN